MRQFWPAWGCIVRSAGPYKAPTIAAPGSGSSPLPLNQRDARCRTDRSYPRTCIRYGASLNTRPTFGQIAEKEKRCAHIFSSVEFSQCRF
jgi:hypothetical protein